MSAAVLEKLLRQGMEALSLEACDSKIKQLLSYVQLLDQWNKHFNLTSVREPEQMVVRHLLDSLSVVPHIQEERVLDVGTGAGLPGVVLAIFNPNKNYVLLDSNGKKTRFLSQVKIELGLSNMMVAKSRAETYHPDHLFPALSSRAFASLANSVALLDTLLAANGFFYAMKGKYPEQEIQELPERYVLEKVHTLVVPGLNEDRHLIVIKRLA